MDEQVNEEDTSKEATETAAEPGLGQAGAERAGGEAGSANLDFVNDVPVKLTVEIGSTKMLVRDLVQLNRGAVVPLDRASGDPADILVNGRLVARGEVSLAEDRVAVRVIELVDRAKQDESR